MKTRGAVVAAVLCAFLSGCAPFLDASNVKIPLPKSATSAVREWNQIAVDTSGLDHTPLSPGEDRVFGHQLGPVKAGRAMAIVHIAMYDALVAIAGGYESYTDVERAPIGTSPDAAVAQAAHDTLVALFPSHKARLDGELEKSLSKVPAGASRDNGVSIGGTCASKIMYMRSGDGSDVAEGYEFSDQPGKWRVDPLNPNQQPLGNAWHNVAPFVIHSCAQFRVPPPPSLDSQEYADAYHEVVRIGGDGVTTPTDRTEDQTQIGIFWAYDGTPSLCAPPRLYNQLAMKVADTEDPNLGALETARLLALVNVSMADAGLAVWDSKYFYDFWRPVTGIREADPGTGPTGLGDGNPDTTCIPTFVPLGAPASNLNANPFTPPFPSYPSGHAGFGGALFESLRNFFGRDDIAFTFVSDELNGVTIGKDGVQRPLAPRSFTSLSQAEEENGQSRIYLGIHWSFDKVQGIKQGNVVADFVFENHFRPKQ